MNFLLIDFSGDNAALLSHSIERKFRGSVVEHCVDSESSLARLLQVQFDAIVVHRTFELDGVSLVRTVRDIQPASVIIGISGFNTGEDLMTAGANDFLHYDEWLRMGTMLEQALKTRQRPW